MTNRERLEKMSDEELAEWLCEHNRRCEGCPCWDWTKGCRGDEQLADWLREEADNDKD